MKISGKQSPKINRGGDMAGHNPCSAPSVTDALRKSAVVAVAAGMTFFASFANAALDFPDVPLQVSPNVPANIMFILDDSGSMAWAYLPDTLPNVYAPWGTPNYLLSRDDRRSARGRASWINFIAYNPASNYTPWMQADGTFMAPANYANVSDSATHHNENMGMDLRSLDQYFYVLPANANGLDITQFEQYRLQSDSSGGGVLRCLWNAWARNYTNCAPAANPLPWGRSASQERANYANWYHYHRTRSKAAKAGASIAFAGMGSNVRVGFRTLHNQNNVYYPIPVDRNRGVFLDEEGYNNRSEWYARLFRSRANGNTPLNTVLKQVGDYFSITHASGPYGPRMGPKNELLSCRQNFAILTTDGYRNQGGLPTVGNQDGSDGPEHTYGTQSFKYEHAQPQNRRFRDSTSNTLADIAMKYWKYDLHGGLDNRVPTTAKNPAFWQHMVTFGVSLGASDDNPDFADRTQALARIEAGTLSWPSSYENNSPDTITDFWHATINGHGDFVVATSPDEFREGLTNALAQIANQLRSNSNLAVSSNRLKTDTRVFSANFDASNWTGDLLAFPLTGGGIDTANPVWSAGQKLSGRPFNTRRIFHTDPSGAKETFSWSNLTPAEKSVFGTESRFDYVRGDYSNEQSQVGGVFRTRQRLNLNWPLGDISGSSPVYDADEDVVYVGANDGMLHAFDGSTGEELFAYVPKGISYADLAELADEDYSHNFYVDGNLVIKDVDVAGAERRLLIGFLGRGGHAGRSSVFALDITNPRSFDANDIMWESNDSVVNNVAPIVLGSPQVLNLQKTGASSSVVPALVYGNGYNGSTGQSALVVLDARTGARLAVNYAGSGPDNGMAEVMGWDADKDGIFDDIYAGDLKGSVWRFDLRPNQSTWSGDGRRKELFRAVDANGNAQPITGGIGVGINPENYTRWLFFGTGRFLESDDRDDMAVQTMYGIQEPADDDVPPFYARGTDLAKRTFLHLTTSNGLGVRTIAKAAAGDMASMKGWYLDFLSPPGASQEGERVTSAPVYESKGSVSALTVASNAPSNDPCAPGMDGWLNFIDPFTGASLLGAFVDINGDGRVDADDMVTGPDGDQYPAGSVNLGTGYAPGVTPLPDGFSPGGGGDDPDDLKTLPSEYLGRISWRELIRNAD